MVALASMPEMMMYDRVSRLRVHALSSEEFVDLNVPESLSTKEATDDLLHRTGKLIVNEYIGTEAQNKEFWLPLVGGIIPALYGIKEMHNREIPFENVEQFIDQLVWMGKDSNGQYELYPSRPGGGSFSGNGNKQEAVLLEDIYDEGHVLGYALELFLGKVKIIAATVKMTEINRQLAEQADDASNLGRIFPREERAEVIWPKGGEIPDVWGEGSNGMNRGTKLIMRQVDGKKEPEVIKYRDPASIAAMQRVFAYPYFNSNFIRRDEESGAVVPDYAEEAKFLSNWQNWCDIAQIRRRKLVLDIDPDTKSYFDKVARTIREENLLVGEDMPAFDENEQPLANVNIVGLLAVIEQMGYDNDVPLSVRASLAKSFLKQFAQMLYAEPAA